MRTKKQKKPLLPKATQEMKDTIKDFFIKNKVLKKDVICKELGIPLMSIYTASIEKKSYISYHVAMKLLHYINTCQQ